MQRPKRGGPEPLSGPGDSRSQHACAWQTAHRPRRCQGGARKNPALGCVAGTGSPIQSNDVPLTATGPRRTSQKQRWDGHSSQKTRHRYAIPITRTIFATKSRTNPPASSQETGFRSGTIYTTFFFTSTNHGIVRTTNSYSDTSTRSRLIRTASSTAGPPVSFGSTTSNRNCPVQLSSSHALVRAISCGASLATSVLIGFGNC